MFCLAIAYPATFVTSPMHCLSLLQAMDGGGGRRRVAAKSSAEDQALDQIAKEVSALDSLLVGDGYRDRSRDIVGISHLFDLGD
ncbi:hypothetical protein GWI33_015175 [Rhynchophorus ferrugineus]|uniref:Uncharacterized protein n=1 Tax=Rhynchophorus ferrugineus TaxID=354439 RepID=A0A834IDS7_RHYFE|nr:hypothetical protein GWI33_015175 [Rhynchophorus ferrugineus]